MKNSVLQHDSLDNCEGGLTARLSIP